MTDQGCQKRLSKYNGLVNRMTLEQIDSELTQRQLPTRLRELLRHILPVFTFGPCFRRS